MYSSFKECQKALDGVAAVDYFFATECIEIVTQNISLDNNQKTILFHVFVKLMNSYKLGHSCEPLSDMAGQTIFSSVEDGINGFKLADSNELKKLLQPLECEGLPIYFAKEFESLYIRRLWLYENEVAKFIKQRLQVQSIDTQKLQVVINELFVANNEIDWQQVAVINSIIRKFSIISGGPGTGKTTTVTKLLLAESLLKGSITHIALLAPTGKAAQRLTESVNHSLCLLSTINDEINQISDNLKTIEAQTIHRFLGLRPNSIYTKYNNEKPAPVDMVVVDEASMLDINIFIKLIRAIGENTKLVLIGDVNQLPSVGVGSLLSGLASNGYHAFSSKATAILDEFDASIPKQKSNLDYVVKLEKNYRSEQHIVSFAKDVLAEQTDYQKHQCDGLVFEGMQMLNKSLKLFAQKYKTISQSKNYQEALGELKKFRILVANRSIAIGTNQLNIKIENLLGRVPNSLYKGKPIMITQNSYSLALYNGDVGILWEDAGGSLKAYFEHKEDKSFAINMLPKFESVYVMTIHKTQGSEFDEVAIILPDESNRVLTKELLYTGITRAKKKLIIVADESVLKETIKKKVKRHSNIKGLIEKLENYSEDHED